MSLALDNGMAGEAVEEPEFFELEPGEGSLALLQKVYRSPRQALSTRIRCAVEALPFEAPKLSAVATTTMNGQDFASLLERAIERSSRAREVKLIEGTCEPVEAQPGIKRRRIA
jgi:hypothetical protein